MSVSKSSPPALVFPSKPTPAGNLPLTSTDLSRLFVSFTSFLVFERPIPEPAQTIRRALSEALVHYYPVAGRVVVTGGSAAGHHGDVVVELACTGEGVAFASATASCTLSDARLLHAPPAIPAAELAPRYGGGGRCRASDPLLMVQVTEFACGGYVVAATWNHGVADAAGLAQILQAVGELARGLPSPAVAPLRHDESLPDIPQLMSSAAIVARRRSQPAPPPSAEFAYTDVTIPWSFINRVKGEFRRVTGAAQPCTTFEVVTAAVWQCRTRAINAGAAAPAPLVFAANVRRHIGSKEGYYGNCVSLQLVAAAAGAVAGGDIIDVVRLIRDAKERIPDTLNGAEQVGLDDDELVETLCGYRYTTLRVSSWSGVGLDAVDFGGGRPARVVPDLERKLPPCCFPCLPCSDRDGASVVAFCVTEDHVEEFHAELARLR